MFKSILVISIGGAAGSLLRWLLNVRLNGLFSVVPFGTLVANLFGCYLIGLAIGYFSSHQTLDPAWRLFVITGFIGGLTTFSKFSAEVVTMMQSGRLVWAFGTISLHVGGSLAMTILGILTVMLIQQH